MTPRRTLAEAPQDRGLTVPEQIDPGSWGCIMTGTNRSSAKLTTVPWKPGSDTPTMVKGCALSWIVLPMTAGSAANARFQSASEMTTHRVLARRQIVGRQQRATEAGAHAEHEK